MIDVNSYYQSESDYIKAADLQAGKKYLLTISEISETEFEQDGKKHRKLTLSFSQAEKKLPLNKTNALVIAGVLGNDAELWKGKGIYIYATKVQFGDKMVDAVRVEMPMEVAQFSQPVRQRPVQDKSAEHRQAQPSEAADSFSNFKDDNDEFQDIPF